MKKAIFNSKTTIQRKPQKMKLMKLQKMLQMKQKKNYWKKCLNKQQTEIQKIARDFMIGKFDRKRRQENNAKLLKIKQKNTNNIQNLNLKTMVFLYTMNSF